MTLAVSGLLWQQSLVMVDQETNSYWSHLLGGAMQGPLQGESLEVIPSIVTDWATWRERYPRTTFALFDRSYQSFDRKSHRQRKHLLLGLVNGDESRYWFLLALREHPLIHDEFAGRAILVCYDAASGTACIFGREVDGAVATFVQREDQLVDEATGTVWDRITGKALSGPLAGRQLERLNGVVSLDLAWSTFYPNSQPGKHGLPDNVHGSR